MPEAHKPNWTDSFPHSFHGWGPQTPDVSDIPFKDEHIRLSVADDLSWRAGEADEDEHVVWSYKVREH